MLKCDLHDYVEIVCLYHYPLKLTLSSGEVLSGTAQTTCYNNERQECLLLKQSDGEQQVVLMISQSRPSLPHKLSVESNGCFNCST